MRIDLSDKTIVICGIVRNAEKGLKRNIPFVNKLCHNFKDYHVVVYENDSVDKTKQLLSEWKKSAPEKVHVFMDDFGKSTIPKASEVTCNPFFSLSRNEKMSGFRNNYLEYVEKQNWIPDYLMVIDLDVSRIDYEGVLSSFNTENDWDAITAFGYSRSPSMRIRYHDVYILVEKGEECIPQTEESIMNKAIKFAKYRSTKELIPVFSAFGGLAIYKYEKVRGLRYKAIPNADARVESRGEHFSLYKQMSDRGSISVYINPQMKIKYQDVDLGLIVKTIKRKLGI